MRATRVIVLFVAIVTWGLAAVFARPRRFSTRVERNTRGLPTGAQLTRFKAWSRRWLWVARCEAHDLEEQRERSLKLKEKRIATAEFHWKLGQLALQRCAERLQNLGAWDESPLPLRSLAQLINAGSQLQRLALGETTADIHVRTPAGYTGEEDGGLDVRRLSVEDQEELARIAGLLEDEYYLPGDPAL